ncbi:hypothetical protein O6H91_13G067000 [Diphasiastrum complanatum]|uniref:Uncharacterized protein n=1 Tax=Diphasiastrum complanatum TaxID=34168 RepID=A0ACC2BVN8_DIPCM|nr:hypothetical protein O6H91_13G067000 [Diphasiastrum complanatum]
MSSKKEGKSQAKAPLTEKGNAKSKGALPSVLKGTPAPPRYKHGEVPPLPAFPITWTPIGVCVESIEENYSVIQVAELINAQTLPALSVSVVDAGEMVEEEMFFEESELGIILVAAKKDYLDKSKGSTNQDWMSPSLLAQSLLVRSCLDKDFEHRKEERRRTNALDAATKASEEARSVLEEAHQHLTFAKEAIEKLIKDEQIRSNLEKESGKALSELLQPFHMENKASSTSSKLADKANAVLDQAKASASQKAEKANNNAQKNSKGKPLSKDDKSGLDDPVQDFKDRLQKMKESILYSENNLQVAQSKVTSAAKHASTLKSSSQQPYVTARIYWCLGFGSTALFIASLAAEKKSIFRAIFNLTVRYQQAAATSDGRQETENGLNSVDRRTSSLSVLPFQKSQIPTLIADMRALVQVSGLNEPARKIAVVDIFYENVVESDIIPGEIKLNQSIKGNEGEQGQKTSETKKAKIGSPDERKGSSLLLNEEIAKSIAIGFQKLVTAVQTYDELEDKLQCQNVQVALPTEDINMRYYHQLLSGVPPALTSVPVILHCILEQVACLDCFSSRANTVEVETQKESSRLAMQNAVDKLGQRTNALSITKSMKQNMQAPYAQPLPVSLHGKERKIIYRRPSTISNQFRTSDVEDIEEGERLTAVQELDRVGRLAAIAQQKEFETISIAEISKHVDVVKVERRMLELLPLPGVSKSARRFMAPSMDALRASNQKFLSIAQRYKKLTMFSSMALKYNESAKDDLRDMRKSHCDKEDLGLAAQIQNHYIGDDEIQRSVLPSGTIVSYKRNGSLQLLLRNGNVSDYVVDSAGLAHWLTTNNKGLSTLKVVSQENISPSPEQKEHTGMNSGNKATVLIGEKITNQTKGKDMISTKEAQAKSAEGKKEKDKIVKDSKTSKKAEDPGRKSGSVKASNDQNNSDNNRKGDLGQIDQLNIISNQKASNEKEFMDVSSTWMPPADKLPFTVAPSKKIVQINDPDTGTSIVTREDLVVVINSPKESTCLVHHADGTQMFSQVMKDINMPSKLNISLLNSSSVIDAGKTCGKSSEGKKCNDAPMWHSKKEGLPDVYGTKEGNIRVRFSTPGGDHWAEWSKSSGNLSFQLPCGNLFHTRSNTTIFEPSDKACFGSPSESHGCTNAGLTLLALKDWESKHFHLGEEQDCKQKAMNTSGKYIFNLAQGTLLHTDKDGNGYMMQKGSIIDFIEEGRVVSLNSFKKDNALVNLSRGGENGSPVSSPISFDAMTSQIKSSMLFSRGPSPRLFVIYEGGHGFEFLNEKTFKDFVNLKKLNKTWIQTSQMIKNCDEDIRSHLFVSLDDCLGFHVRKGKQATPFLASKLSNSAILLEDSSNRKFHEESKNNPANLGRSQLDMALPNLPRVILPSNISTLQNRKEAALILYRQIYEYSATFEEQTAQVEMEEEACARWKDSKYMHNHCRKPSESRAELSKSKSLLRRK